MLSFFLMDFREREISLYRRVFTSCLFVGGLLKNLFCFTKEKEGAMSDEKNGDGAVHVYYVCNGICDSISTGRIR